MFVPFPAASCECVFQRTEAASGMGVSGETSLFPCRERFVDALLGLLDQGWQMLSLCSVAVEGDGMLQRRRLSVPGRGWRSRGGS